MWSSWSLSVLKSGIHLTSLLPLNEQPINCLILTGRLAASLHGDANIAAPSNHRLGSPTGAQDGILGGMVECCKKQVLYEEGSSLKRPTCPDYSLTSCGTA